MRLVLACEIYPPAIGGPATFIKKLLPVLEAENIESTVLTYAADSREAVGVKKVSLKLPLPLRYLIYFFHLLRISRSADLIFAQGPTASGLPSALVKKIFGTKVWIKVVGDTAWERAFNSGRVTEMPDQFQTKQYGFTIEIQKKIRSWALRQCDLIITPSEYLKKMVSGWGVDEKKVKVILNSFDQKQAGLQPTKESTKAKLGLSGKIILTAGRLTLWKGFSALVELMPEFLKINPDFKLVIVGSGPEESNLKNKISNLGLTDKIIMTGQIQQPTMSDYYQAADLFILNSGYEGLSHTLLEALSFNLPILSSSTGGNMEIIKHSKTGWIFDYNNREQILEGVAKLENEETWLEKFKVEVEKILPQFSSQKMFAEYLEILKNYKEL